jgi:hypothetical protein
MRPGHRRHYTAMIAHCWSMWVAASSCPCPMSSFADFLFFLVGVFFFVFIRILCCVYQWAAIPHFLPTYPRRASDTIVIVWNSASPRRLCGVACWRTVMTIHV